MDLEKERCEICKYFKQGRCFRFPPKGNSEGNPIVRKDYWCGEYSIGGDEVKREIKKRIKKVYL